jgi:hypothetical protein
MAEVAGLALALLPNASRGEIRRAALSAIQELLSTEYVRIGDLTRTGFVAWPISPAEAMERVEREWTLVGTPRLGEIGWLESTEAGREIRLSIAGSRSRSS